MAVDQDFDQLTEQHLAAPQPYYDGGTPEEDRMRALDAHSRASRWTSAPAGTRYTAARTEDQ